MSMSLTIHIFYFDYFLAIYNFHGKGLYQLKLQLGETVQILEESPGEDFGFWYLIVHVIESIR